MVIYEKRNREVMKLIRKITTKEFTEIEVETRFLFWKSRSKYRCFVSGQVMSFKEPNNYFSVGMFELAEIRPLFSAPDTVSKEVPKAKYMHRRDILSRWKDANPLIPDGQLIFILDRQVSLCGDGEKTFKELYDCYLKSVYLAAKHKRP